MEKFTKHTGKAVAIDLANVDTDQIIPKQFLKRIERTGYGEFLFYDWRFTSSGDLIDNFILNRPESAGATILIAGENFGCGSSREHAPWSLLDFGFRVIIAPSFADIFYNNSLKTGLLPIELPTDSVKILSERATSTDSLFVSVDLAMTTITDDHGFQARFEIDEFRKNCLLNGLDDIGLTLQHEHAITDFEHITRETQPFLVFNS